ncbi:MAG: site-2 protease family protein [Gammaproteobacteria bacterium]|nr:site-2 protease family protein [Gammaproteobacteria bacterium]
MSPFELIVIWALPVVFGITVHEVAHGWMALRLGDRTAQMLGRLTLNPIRHIDPVGTILVPAVLLMLGGFVFGWAKPVPVTWENLRRPQRDMALVALAGPLANVLMAVIWLLVLLLGIALQDMAFARGLIYMAAAGILINAVLMVLNLLPVPPLDGSRVVAALLPRSLRAGYGRLEPFGLLILVLLIATGLLGPVMRPLMWGFFEILFSFSETGLRHFLWAMQVVS